MGKNNIVDDLVIATVGELFIGFPEEGLPALAEELEKLPQSHKEKENTYKTKLSCVLYHKEIGCSVPPANVWCH